MVINQFDDKIKSFRSGNKTFATMGLFMRQVVWVCHNKMVCQKEKVNIF